MAVELTIYNQTDYLDQDYPLVPVDASGHTFENIRGDVQLIFLVSKPTDIVVTMLSARNSNFGVFPDKQVTFYRNRLTTSPIWNWRRFTDVATGLAEFTVDDIANVSVTAMRINDFYREVV